MMLQQWALEEMGHRFVCFFALARDIIILYVFLIFHDVFAVALLCTKCVEAFPFLPGDRCTKIDDFTAWLKIMEKPISESQISLRYDVRIAAQRGGSMAVKGYP